MTTEAGVVRGDDLVLDRRAVVHPGAVRPDLSDRRVLCRRPDHGPNALRHRHPRRIAEPAKAADREWKPCWPDI